KNGFFSPVFFTAPPNEGACVQGRFLFLQKKLKMEKAFKIYRLKRRSLRGALQAHFFTACKAYYGLGKKKRLRNFARGRLLYA
ncbi:MAG: hypothetical protein PUK72_00140, partial [Oscillospiraceae bacterium]|nr:hypothetical protein [Oscillospiraceae bacterium]